MRKTNALYLKTQRLIAETHRYTKRDTHTDAHRDTHRYTHRHRHTERDTQKETHTHKETHTKRCFRGLPFLLLHTWILRNWCCRNIQT